MLLWDAKIQLFNQNKHRLTRISPLFYEELCYEHKKKNTITANGHDATLTLLRKEMWSWWDSNPRPNRETIRFLHVYSSLWFSCDGKTWTTNRRLSP